MNQQDPLNDPTVKLALQQVERNATLEAKQDAILAHCARIDGHLATLNGRVGKVEDESGGNRNALTSLMQQREDRAEYQRLQALEVNVAELQKAQAEEKQYEAGVASINNRDKAILAALVAGSGLSGSMFMALYDRLFG